MPYVVGFASQARGGKNEAGEYLCKRLNELCSEEWHCASLARAVKKIFSDNFGVSTEFIEEWKVKQEIPEGFQLPLRDGLTMIGNDWRKFKSDIWIEKLFKDNDKNIIVTDVRYFNEVDAITGKSDLPYMKKYKGVAILLWRPGYENNKQTASEQELMPCVRKLEHEHSGFIIDQDIPFDIWLRNNGTLEDWYKKIDDIVVPYVIKKFQLEKKC